MHLQVQGEVQRIWITGKLKKNKEANYQHNEQARTGSHLICLVDERGYCSALFTYLIAAFGFAISRITKNKQARAGPHLVCHDKRDYCSRFIHSSHSGFRLHYFENKP